MKISAERSEWIARAQARLGRSPSSNRTFADYLRCARWWRLEALRGHDWPVDRGQKSWERSAEYSRNMKWAAELTRIYGPGTWLELIAAHRATHTPTATPTASPTPPQR
jgi:hypothetical protein